MGIILIFLFSAGILPLVRAWVVCRGSTIRHTLTWAVAAWAFWTLLIFVEVMAISDPSTIWTYTSLCLTACAGLAVLGARRPGVGAWNFVVGGLLAVFLLPVAEGFGEPRLQLPHLIFLGICLLVAIANYAPTRLRASALMVAVACAFQLFYVAGVVKSASPRLIGYAILLISPWLGWICLRNGSSSASRFDANWLSFRDRFGWFWGQRMREQFNRVANNAGWTVWLGWSGIDRRGEVCPNEEELYITLVALLGRFTWKKSNTNVTTSAPSENKANSVAGI